jgi:hypothetical protein
MSTFTNTAQEAFTVLFTVTVLQTLLALIKTLPTSLGNYQKQSVSGYYWHGLLKVSSKHLLEVSIRH